MRALTIAGPALALVLAGCSAPQSGPGDDLLDAYGLAGKDTVEIIEHLDTLPVDERPDELMASVRHDELLVADPEQEISLEMPEDSVYVAFAPYVDQTHECFYHSLTTCLGELGSEPLDIEITDEATGEVLVDERTTTFDNGFVGYWLPRNTAGTVEVTHDSRTGSADFTTDADGATCITTLRLTE